MKGDDDARHAFYCCLAALVGFLIPWGIALAVAKF